MTKAEAIEEAQIRAVASGQPYVVYRSQEDHFLWCSEKSVELVAVEYRWKRQVGLAVIRLLVREYGASEGTIIDLNGEHEELLESLLQAHAIGLELHLLKWDEGIWQEVE